MFITPTLRSLLESIDNISSHSYVVGGFIREHFLDQDDAADIDIAVSGDGFQIAQSLYEQLNGTVYFAPLDQVNGCGRLIIKDIPRLIVDISTMKAPTIRGDLENRDFTINAMAIRLKDFLESGFDALIDPLQGLVDLNNHVIRMCSPYCFIDDPLRVLRAYRFMTQLDFSMDAATHSLLKESVGDLNRVSGERIRDELFQILSQPSCFPALQAMDEAGALKNLFPELIPMRETKQNKYHSRNVWDHSMECVRQLEELLNGEGSISEDHTDQVLNYVKEEITPGRSRLWLLKLSCIFHDSGKPKTLTVDNNGVIHFYGHERLSVEIFAESIEYIKLSNREQELVAKLIGGHMRLSSMTSVKPSRRFIFRLTERFRVDVIGLLLIFLSDLKASDGPARTNEHIRMATLGVKDVLEYYFTIPKEPPQPLLNGYDLISILQIPQGPQIGTILKLLREKQALGMISSREEAIAEVSKMAGRLLNDQGSESI